jgi:hypothetical protein
MKGEEDCSKKVQDLGGFVLATSVFALCVGILMNSTRPVGGFGRFSHATSSVWILLGGWGVATGIGLLRKWRWARISMLVFCFILVIIGSFLFLVILVAPSRDPRGWTLELIFGKVLLMAVLFLPPFVGVRWCLYFTRRSVKSHFQKDGTTAQQIVR